MALKAKAAKPKKAKASFEVVGANPALTQMLEASWDASAAARLELELLPAWFALPQFDSLLRGQAEVTSAVKGALQGWVDQMKSLDGAAGGGMQVPKARMVEAAIEELTRRLELRRKRKEDRAKGRSKAPKVPSAPRVVVSEAEPLPAHEKPVESPKNTPVQSASAATSSSPPKDVGKEASARAPTGGSSRAPTDPQIDFAERLAAQHGLQLPEGYKTDLNVCKAFLDRYSLKK